MGEGGGRGRWERRREREGGEEEEEGEGKRRGVERERGLFGDAVQTLYILMHYLNTESTKYF